MENPLVLYLGEVYEKHKILRTKLRVRLLACLEEEQGWQKTDADQTISLNSSSNLTAGEFVLVSIDHRQTVKSIQAANHHLIGLLKSYSNQINSKNTSTNIFAKKSTVWEQENQTSNLSMNHAHSSAFIESPWMNSSSDEGLSLSLFEQPDSRIHNKQAPTSIQLGNYSNQNFETFKTNKLLSFYYQPILHLQSKNITSIEVFVQHCKSLESISTIIGSNDILSCDKALLNEYEALLTQIFLQFETWHNSGFKPLSIAIPIPFHLITQTDFVQVMSVALSKTKLKAEDIEVQLNFNQNWREFVKIELAAEILKSYGYRTILDCVYQDFNIASSLQKELFDTIKINVSRVRGVEFTSFFVETIRALITLAKEHGIEIIANGVETREQMNLLTSINCDAVQGDLINVPLSAIDISDVLSANWLGRK